MARIVLASTSPYRRQMLETAGLEVCAVAPGVPEDRGALEEPAAVAEHLALRKAEAVAGRFPEELVLGADQVVTDGREIWGKPRGPADHLARLKAMRGRVHTLITGFALLGPGLRHLAHETTHLAVRADLEDAELEAYVATGEGSGCAGGYAAEGRGAFLFERIEGDWFNVLGLPLLRVLDVLRARGWRFPGAP